MGIRNESHPHVVITRKIVEKMLDWATQKEAKFIKADPDFWTVDRYYLLLNLKLGGWFDAIMASPEKQISEHLSLEVAQIVGWFTDRYATKKD